MFCMYCGQELPDGARFCMKCGTPQGAISPQATNDSSTATPQPEAVPSPFKPLSSFVENDELPPSAFVPSPFKPLGSSVENDELTQGAFAPSPFKPLNSTNSNINNYNAGTTLVPAMCPNCNAHMEVNPSLKIARCNSCGTECLVQEAVQALNISGSVNVVHSGVVVQKHEQTGAPNLHISYSSTIPSVSMSLDINPVMRKIIFTNGSTQSFKLAPGVYMVNGKIGSLFEQIHDSFSRRIEINDEHPTVTIIVGVKPGFLQNVYVNVC